MSVSIGLAAAVLVGGLAVILAFRIPCKKNKRGKETMNNITIREGSPGPSDKSGGSKDMDENDSDEKNPDIIPDTIDSDEKVCSKTIIL